MKKAEENGGVTPDPDRTKSCNQRSRTTRCYEIRFKGHLADHWAAWFHGCSLTREEDGTTVMVAPVTDQAELFGLLNKVRDLSLPVISVNEIELPEDIEDM